MTREIQIQRPLYRAFCDICREEGQVLVFSLGANDRMDVAICDNCARYIVEYNSDENRENRRKLGVDVD